MLKILKYNNNTLTNQSIDNRNTPSRTNLQLHHRKSHRFFFKPYIDISDLIGTRSTINEHNLYVWTIKIQNTDNKIKKKLKLSKNATNCNCHVDILKDKESIISGQLALFQNLPKFDFTFNNHNIDNLIKKYCEKLNEYIKIEDNIIRDSFKELLFLITVENSDFVYFIEKQDNQVLDENYYTNLNSKIDLVPIKQEYDKYDINLVFNCKEKKDERGRTYLLTVSSWNDVKLSHVH